MGNLVFRLLSKKYIIQSQDKNGQMLRFKAFKNISTIIKQSIDSAGASAGVGEGDRDSQRMAVVVRFLKSSSILAGGDGSANGSGNQINIMGTLRCVAYEL